MSDPTRSDPSYGYTSPPPPGAGGMPTQSPYSTAPAGTWQLASWWSRVGAQLIDAILIGVVATLVIVILVAIGASGFLANDTAGVVGVIVTSLIGGLLVLAIVVVYAPLMMSRTDGQTLGRMATGIRVVRADGKPMDFGYAMLREVVVKWLLFNVVGGSVTFGLAWFVDVLWPLWDEENRALHDMVVNSRVIRA
jgi:uncharacterized RDD family membrane protein YckC